ncbi:MAG: PAS domain S-box protein [Deltaproteobacteria bacterium]|nr:PAS domain S-box protein [Deltaproteobacteria bacterium]
MKSTENNIRLSIVTCLIVGAIGLTFYFHGLIESDAVFTHLFYIPIILSTLWWKVRGLITPILMATILILSHWFFRPMDPFTHDLLRSAMFMLVAVIVIRLSVRISRTETELRNHRDHLEELVSERTFQLTSANELLMNEIDARKSVAENLRESEEIYRLLAETAREIIITSDMGGKLTYINPEGLKMSGYSESEISALSLSDILTSDQFDAIVSPDSGSDDQKKGLILHGAQFLTKTGSVVPVEVSSATLIKENQLYGFLLTARDVTWRKEIEEDHKQIEKLEAIGVLAGGIAHDFNNILMAIVGNVSMVKQYAGKWDSIFPLLAAIEEACRRASDLTHQFLTFSSGGKPLKEKGSITGILRGSSAEVLKDSAISCLIHIADDLSDVEIDPQLIRHVISNIVANAREAMPSGGVLSIYADNFLLRQDSPIADLPLLPGHYVRVTLRDEGVGIAETQLSRIFDPYFSTKEIGTRKGKGLGLTMVHSIIQKHHGHIQIQSLPGKGTTVMLYLPAFQEEPGVVLPSENREPSEKNRVLLMDDEDMIREITGEMLRHLGYDVECAENSDQALALYQRGMESKMPYDAAILDIHIPDGVGGIETLQRLRVIDPGVKAIVSSGYSVDSVLTDFRKYGFAGCLAKPYRLEELEKTLHDVLTR